MTISKSLYNNPEKPYWDDFDESKNYHRILFKPGYSVQARELTQLQTALQAQIDKYGQWAFNNGSRVIGGKVAVNIDYDFIKVEDVFNSTIATGSAATYTTSTNLNDFVGKIITGTGNSGNQVQAKVIAVSSYVSPGEPITLFIKYLSSGGPDKNVKAFGTGEVFGTNTGSRYGKVGGGTGSATEYVGADVSNGDSLITGDSVGTGSSVSIEEGVYFLHGSFVHIPTSTLILDKYTNTPTYSIGLSVVHSIVSSGSDQSLNDNASGTPNHTAPGADRLKIVATLIKENVVVASQTTTNFIPLVLVKDGVTQTTSTDPIDTTLSDRFATRTFEESGNYAVRPFILDINEHLNDEAGNNGYLSADDGGDSSKMAITVEPSVAYVQGYRVEKTASDPIVIDKPRSTSDTATAAGATTSTPLGNYIKLTTDSTTGIPDINNLATVTLYSAVNQSTPIGTARARGLEYIAVNPAHYRLYLFDLQMTGTNIFSSVKSVGQVLSGVDFKGNLGTGASSNITAGATLFDTSNNTLVFKLPYDTVKTLETSGSTTGAYKIRQRVTTNINSSSKAVFTISNGVLANDDDIQISIANHNSGRTFEISEVDSASGGVNNSQFTLTATETGQTMTSGIEVSAIVTVLRTNFQPKTKSRQTVTKTIAYSAGTSTYGLGVADAIRVTSIRDGANTLVTDKFVVDNGQRANFYDEASIILKGGESIAPGNMTIILDHYTHTGGDYFSVDSYYTPGSPTPSALEAAKYEEIPSFKSSNGVVDLRDCLDFRPVKALNGSFAGGISSLSSPIAPNNIATNDVTIFLPRKDKLFITKEGAYKYITGVSDLNPVAPENVKDAMPLYTLNISPYVFNKLDIKPVPFDNKRYTMRDIGKLDKRIKTLEYYTSLSLLEKSAQGTPLLDGDGNPRIKNGFIVDNFTGHNVGNSNDPDYQISVDKDAGIARPSFDERGVNLIRKSNDTGTCVNSSVESGVKGNTLAGSGDMVTLPYTTANYIDQPFSTYAEFVNPYDIFVWEGKIELSPASDEWKEVDVRPDIIIDDTSVYDQFVAMSKEEGILGTVWNEWETNWTGREVTETTSNKRLVSRNKAEAMGFVAPGRNGGRRAEVQDVQKAITETGSQSRSGLTTSVASDTQFKEVGDYVVETNFIPFIRSRKIFFNAELLKPNSKLDAFFNGTKVTSYCRQESSFVKFSTRSNVKSHTGETTHPDSNSGALVTDAAGRCIGSFIIPRNDVLKFKTGTREFKLTDSPTNDSSEADTYASANYYAQGLLEVHQKTIIATKVPRLVTREVSSASKAVSRTTFERSTELIRWTDPVAQTFTITDPDSTGAGVFLNEIELFFESIDANIPLEVSIRSVDNGYPTQKVIPGSDVTVYPANINTSVDASAETVIRFKHPVYLERDSEYSIVLIANSADYKVYVSEVGGMDLTITNKRVNKQPYNGVFFTSANASTWTAEQTKDLKFKLNRCQFSTTANQFVTLVNDSIEPKKLNPDSLEYIATNKIRVYHSNHGHYGSGSHQVIIAGYVAGNGITNIAHINKAHTITEIEHDSYVITHAGTATTVGIFGGGDNVTATENMLYNTLVLKMENTQVPGTSIQTDLTGISAASQDSTTQQSYTAQNQIEILPNSNFVPEKPYMVMSPNANGGATTLTEIKCTLNNNGNDRISPTIDLERTSLFTIQNRINDATAPYYANNSRLVAETQPSGTTNLAKYITKKIELENEADLIDIYMSVARPADSSVDLYYKVQSGADDSDFTQLNWRPANPVNTIPVSDSGMSEAHFEINPTVANSLAGGVIDGAFSKFAIKVVLRSRNSSNVPMLGDFRAIATTA